MGVHTFSFDFGDSPEADNWPRHPTSSSSFFNPSAISLSSVFSFAMISAGVSCVTSSCSVSL